MLALLSHVGGFYLRGTQIEGKQGEMQSKCERAQHQKQALVLSLTDAPLH